MNVEFFICFRLLKATFHLQFEENTSRSELPCKCYFVTTTSRAFRPSVVDLCLPDSKGMFRTPNPSPNTSPASTPTAGMQIDESQPTVNSPDLPIQKFKVPLVMSLCKCLKYYSPFFLPHSY